MATSIYEQFKQLTPQEQHYITSHPHHVLAIRDSKEKAYDETKNYFVINGRNDKSDAFRHCFWSALLAREIGYANALQFTTAHESQPFNPKDEKAMDIHNNGLGLSIGRTGGPDYVLIQNCMAALMGGQLKILVK